MAATGPPDGGYGWVILTAASLCMALVVSIARIGGMVFYIVIEEFNVTRAEASLILVIARLCAFTAAPITSQLLAKSTYRKVFCAGGILASLGLILTSRATALWHVILSYGILLGSGLGLLLTSSILIIGIYFKKRRSFAIGIYYTSGGVGSLVMPIIFGQLLEEYWFQGSLLILGGVMLNICALSMLIRQPNWLPRKDTVEKEMQVKYVSVNNGQTEPVAITKTNGHSENGESDEKSVMMVKDDGAHNQLNKNKSTICQRMKATFVGLKNSFAIFKDLTFVLQLLSRVGSTVALLTMISYLPDYMKHEFDVPMNDKEVANVLAMAAIGDTVARFTVGSFLEKLPWSKKTTVSVLSLVIGVILFLLQEAKDIEALLGCVITYGLVSGCYVVTLMVLEAELMGPKKLPVAHGFSQFFVGILSMIIGILIGYLRDLQGTYRIGIYILATCSSLSGFVWFLEPLLIRRTKTTEDESTKDESVVLNANIESVA